MSGMLGIPSTQDAYEMFGVDKQSAQAAASARDSQGMVKNGGESALSQMIRMKTNHMVFANSPGTMAGTMAAAQQQNESVGKQVDQPSM